MAKVKGLDKVLNMLTQKEKQITSKIKNVVESQGKEMRDDAKNNAVNISYLKPKSTSFVYLPNKIKSEAEEGGFSHVVKVKADNQAAYIEFGTGVFAEEELARRPSEWGPIAMQFFVNGKGFTIAQPYLYPAFAKRGPLFIEKLREGLIQVCGR